MAELHKRLELIKQELAGSAGLDPLADRWRAGAYAAYSDFFNLEFEEEESPE